MRLQLTAALLAFGLALESLVAGCSSDAPALDVLPPLDLEMSRSLATLEGAELRSWSSREREPFSYPMFPHGNKDFNNFVVRCGERASLPFENFDAADGCEAGLGGHLIARDDAGPGSITRFYFTSGSDRPNAHGRILEERIRIYVDDLSRPLYDLRLDSLRDGGESPFQAPSTGWTSGALASYVAIPYSTRMRVLLDDLRSDSIYYYQVEARGVARELPSEEAVVAGETLASDQSVALAPGELRRVFERDGPGQIDRLTFELPSAAASRLAEIDLILEWDDLARPALELPLARLFACSQELRAFRTAPLSVEQNRDKITLRFELPMPFARRAQLSLRNRGAVPSTLRATLAGTTAVPSGDWGRLHTELREAEGPFTPVQSFVATSQAGPGKLVGIIMFFDGRGHAADGTPHPISFLEGDPIAIVDGALVMHGTGTEDFFNSGWYFQDGPFEAPFGALVSTATDLTAGTARLTAVRWLLGGNAIEYQQTFELQFEYGAFEPLAAQHYAALAFHYLR